MKTANLYLFLNYKSVKIVNAYDGDGKKKSVLFLMVFGI